MLLQSIMQEPKALVPVPGGVVGWVLSDVRNAAIPQLAFSETKMTGWL